MILHLRLHAARLSNLIIVGPLLIISPFVLMTAYLWCVDRWFGWNSSSDVAALIVALLTGVVGVCLVPSSRAARALTIIAYIPAVGWLMIFLGLSWRGGI